MAKIVSTYEIRKHPSTALIKTVNEAGILSQIADRIADTAGYQKKPSEPAAPASPPKPSNKLLPSIQANEAKDASIKKIAAALFNPRPNTTRFVVYIPLIDLKELYLKNDGAQELANHISLEKGV